jgi:peptide/nickel transport system substrate-binding protein
MFSLRVLAVALIGIFGAMTAAFAQEPQRGGTLVFGLSAEPPTYDCHQSNTYATLDVVSPHYSLLIRFDPKKPGEYEPDLAQSWEISKDGLAYTFKLYPDIHFHDGSPLTSADVKASFDRIRNPPPGIISQRKAVFAAVTAIETPDPATVIFRLTEIDAGLLNNIASPWSCIYSAAMLQKDPRFPDRNIMGSGPFKFVEHVPGSHWLGRRFDDYFKPGRPYLDEFRAVFVNGPAMINSLAGGQVMAEFRGISPAERDRIVASRGDRVQILESSAWVQMFQVTFNTKKPPFDDERVRRALAMAIDRRGNAAAMSRISFLGPISSFMPPGSFWALPPDRLETMPGFGHDAQAAKAEARRLLKEAGVPNLTLKLVNRTQLTPYTPFGVFVIDQWRQIGVTAEHVLMESAAWQRARDTGNFDALVEAVAEHSDDPSTLFVHYVSSKRSPINYSGSDDSTVDDLFDRQQHTLDRDQRRELVRQIDERVLTKAYATPVFWTNRIIPLAAEVRGWNIMQSHFLGQDLRDVWLAH